MTQTPSLDKARQRQRTFSAGIKAERWAGWLMRAKGFSILERRFKTRGGEIDLICRKKELLVFLEVKYRQSLEEAIYAITPRNQARIITAAQSYLAQEPCDEIGTYRFDVLAFAPRQGLKPQWQHLEAAFELF